MAANSFFKIFLPKDRIFYSLFESVADTVHKMGITLQEMVYEADEDKRAGKLAQIENMEHKNDDLTHTIQKNQLLQNQP